MGLLDELRSSNGTGHYNTWSELPGNLASMIPDYLHRKMVLIRGEVIVIGSVITTALPRHFYAVMHSERTAADIGGTSTFPHRTLLQPLERPPGRRPVAMGISRYRADSEANYYSSPWVEWVRPTPESFAAWITKVLAGTTKDTPYLEYGTKTLPHSFAD